MELTPKDIQAKEGRADLSKIQLESVTLCTAPAIVIKASVPEYQNQTLASAADLNWRIQGNALIEPSSRIEGDFQIPVGSSPIRKLLVDKHQDACGLLRFAISNGKRASIR